MKNIEEKVEQIKQILGLGQEIDDRLQEELDDLVHDVASNIASMNNNTSGNESTDDGNHDTASVVASKINNDGVHAQLKYLLEQRVMPTGILNVLGVDTEKIPSDIDWDFEF